MPPPHDPHPKGKKKNLHYIPKNEEKLLGRKLIVTPDSFFSIKIIIRSHFNGGLFFIFYRDIVSLRKQLLAKLELKNNLFV